MCELVNANNVMKADTVMNQMFSEIIPKVQTPFFLITAGQDTVCDSNTAKKFFDTSKVEDK